MITYHDLIKVNHKLKDFGTCCQLLWWCFSLRGEWSYLKRYGSWGTWNPFSQMNLLLWLDIFQSIARNVCSLCLAHRILNITLLEDDNNFTDSDIRLVLNMLTGRSTGYTTLFHFLSHNWEQLRERYVHLSVFWSCAVNVICCLETPIYVLSSSWTLNYKWNLHSCHMLGISVRNLWLSSNGNGRKISWHVFCKWYSTLQG
jgi:hypothetical protein